MGTLVPRTFNLADLIHREKFGIHNVDLNDPTRRRTPKGTASFLKKIYQDNGFVEE